MDGLKRLDALPFADARAAFHRCCGCSRWAEAMARGRPYAGEEALVAAGERAFADLGREDWLEAFSHHPRIGDTEAREARSAATREWSKAEQGRVGEAPEPVKAALLEKNRAYAARFGYSFIVCATGKGAREMLTALEERLGNDPERELSVAAAEQRKITALRLRRLVAEVT
jgi:2-oxo-4-hydroxy-4-carboxy-5-ureidoimidazoline decarboxylase